MIESSPHAESFDCNEGCRPEGPGPSSWEHSTASRGARFRYRDARLPVEERVSDLLSHMTLAEKAGQLFHNLLHPGPQGRLAAADPRYGLEDTKFLLEDKLMSHFNLIGAVADPKLVAIWHNNLQKHILDHTRLGIPVTLSTDPRSHFDNNVGTGFKAGMLSQWPSPFGLAALRCPSLTRQFADVVRREYIALGIRVALHPQADLTTEYRWARVGSTFGENVEVASDLTLACIEGLQTNSFGAASVSTTTKHFPGAGPEMDGEDSHFVYGKEQVYPGGKFEYHLEPFRRAIRAGTRQIMPSYAMPVGTKYEQVGFGFNKNVITGLLRQELGFDGVVLTDWGLITDAVIAGQDMPARAWGCENLSELERLVKIVDSGCDQIGGESRPELAVEAVGKGLIPESRLDKSVRRILREKFELGLFDEKRFVSIDAAGDIVGSPEFVALGRAVQRQAFTLLTNGGDVFPLAASKKEKRYYIEGVDTEVARRRGLTIVSEVSEADVALLRLQAPYEKRPGGFESHFHAGSLEFSEMEANRIAHIIDIVPISIVDVYLDRPAVLTPIVAAQRKAEGRASNQRLSALIVDYGSEADAFFDVCFDVGDSSPQGKLPFDLPRSMEAVKASGEDMSFDTKDPLFAFGHGLPYIKKDAMKFGI